MGGRDGLTAGEAAGMGRRPAGLPESPAAWTGIMGRGEAQGMPGETTYTILIVEDDATIARLLQENLARWGFDAR